MEVTFDKALNIAKSKYPLPINRFEEYKDYFVFEHDDGEEHVGGVSSPIVIRKSDGAALNYEPIFFNMDIGAEDPGEVLKEGDVR